MGATELFPSHAQKITVFLGMMSYFFHIRPNMRLRMGEIEKFSIYAQAQPLTIPNQKLARDIPGESY